jgi:hypothetical protein
MKRFDKNQFVVWDKRQKRQKAGMVSKSIPFKEPNRVRTVQEGRKNKKPTISFEKSFFSVL